jgi:hypothetical protein
MPVERTVALAQIILMLAIGGVVVGLIRRCVSRATGMI